MTNVCNVSQDCVSEGVVRLCYETASFSEEQQFCDCSNWFGWSGERCDKPTGQLYYWRFSLLFTITLSFALFCSYLRVLLPRLRRVVDSKPPRTLFLVATCFLCATTMILLTAAFTLPSAFDSKRFSFLTVQTLERAEVTTVVPSLGEAAYYVQALSLVFSLYGSMFIILSWINVLKDTSKVFPAFLSTRMLRLSIFLKLFVGVSTVIMLALLIARNLEVLLFFSAWVLFLTVLIYCYLTVAFIRKIGDVACEARKLVQTSFTILFVCMVLAMLCIGLSQVTSIDYFEKLGIGQFNHSMFLQDMAIWFALCMASFALCYVKGRLKYREQGDI